MVTAGRVLSLGYFDHPPASWWLAWGSAHLFGSEAPLVVRLPFILLFAVSQLLMARITRRIADERAAWWAVVALNLSPVLGVTTGTWVLPDGPLDTALLGAALCLLHALAAERRPGGPWWRGPWWGWRWWLGAGLCAGLALFAKYSAVLLILGALLYLLTSAQQRHWLRRPEPYVAGLLALAVFSPVVVWNATHHWASFAFQGDRAEGLRFRPLAPFGVWAGEALFILPWIWLPLILLFIGAFRRTAPWTDRLLTCLAAPPVVLFALISAWSSQKVLYHWAAPGYLMLFPLLGRALAARGDPRWIRRCATATAALVVIVLAVIVAQIQFDVVGGRLAAMMRQDPTEQGLDWISVRSELQERGLLRPGTVVAALNWRDAGKFGYALGPDYPILCLNQDARQFRFADPPSDHAGADVLVLALAPPARAQQLASPWFRSTSPEPDVTISLNGRVLSNVTVLRGDGLIPATRRDDRNARGVARETWHAAAREINTTPPPRS